MLFAYDYSVLLVLCTFHPVAIKHDWRMARYSFTRAIFKANNEIQKQTALKKSDMEGVQPEALVVLLYLSLVYEIISCIKRRGQQSIEKMRKVSVRLGKPSRGNDRKTGTRLQTRLFDNSHQTYRHFVQMRILARD